MRSGFLAEGGSPFPTALMRPPSKSTYPSLIVSPETVWTVAPVIRIGRDWGGALMPRSCPCAVVVKAKARKGGRRERRVLAENAERKQKWERRRFDSLA